MIFWRIFFLSLCITIYSCKENKATNTAIASGKSVADNHVNEEKIDALIKQYPEIPNEKILEQGPIGEAVYAELKIQYEKYLKDLKSAIEANKAKMVMVILTPEVGNSITTSTREGVPYLKNIFKQLDIEYIDLTPLISAKDGLVITQMPKDGHWSKKGAELLASYITPYIKKYDAYKSAPAFNTKERPFLLGDLEPNLDEIRDGGKDIPYRLITNTQGLRMNYNLTFPKKKQRILFLGDSEFFCPFLDNDFTITQVLQNSFPDKEVINAAILGYSIDDYASLYKSKAQYTEADIVFVSVNGNDITDLFFTHRNKLSRNRVPHEPSSTEKKIYQDMYPSK